MWGGEEMKRMEWGGMVSIWGDEEAGNRWSDGVDTGDWSFSKTGRERERKGMVLWKERGGLYAETRTERT